MRDQKLIAHMRAEMVITELEAVTAVAIGERTTDAIIDAAQVEVLVGGESNLGGAFDIELPPLRPGWIGRAESQHAHAAAKRRIPKRLAPRAKDLRPEARFFGVCQISRIENSVREKLPAPIA